MYGPLKIVLSQKFIADRGLNKKLKTIDKVLENNEKTKVLNFQFLGFCQFWLRYSKSIFFCDRAVKCVSAFLERSLSESWS